MSKKDDANPSPEDLGIPITEIPPEPENSENAEPVNEGPAPKKRGRPSGSTNKTSSADKPKKTRARRTESSESLAQQIMGIHQIAFLATQLPECQITKIEAMMLAESLNNVAEEYGLSLTGKTGAAIQLFGAAAIIYVPRYFSVLDRMKKAEEAKNAERSRTIDINEIVPGAHGTASH